MANILFLNVTGSTNKGDMAVVVGHINCIRHYLPGAEMTILSGDVSVDRIYEDYGVKVQPHPWYKRRRSMLLSLAHTSMCISYDVVKRLFYSIAEKFNRNYQHPYNQYDLVIDPHADGFNEPYYGFSETFYFLVFLYFAQLLIRKPIIMGPTSLGPLTSRLNKWLAKFLFNRVEVITLREKVSQDYLQEHLAIDKPRIYLIDDLAFLLEPSLSERITRILKEMKGNNSSERPLVGITPNRGMMEWNRPPDYALLMADIIDYLIERLDARILLIPQTGDVTTVLKVKMASDNVVSSEIYSHVRSKHAVTIVSNEITLEEWKAVIGSCDLFIGCRLHCSIMSTSMCVPTVTLSYGHKVNALIGGMMGQGETLVGIQNSDFTQILSELRLKIDYVWANRERIREELKERNKEVRQRALTYGALVKQLLDT